jgi:CheY-like chemotaxis protein
MTLRLFVADDSVTIQKIVGLAFSGEDAVVKSVSNGDSALDEVRAFKPDLVLVDVFMPGCNGYEVCAQIKEDPELRETPVLLLVGTFEPFDESEASRVKSDGYLTKPFDTSELIQTVHRLVEKKSEARQAEETAAMNLARAVSMLPVSSATPIESPVAHGSVSAVAWESFLGSDRILELFDTETLASAEVKKMDNAESTEEMISDKMLDLIVDRVVRRMSADVVREVAWEVVPELSEVIIRRAMEEHGKR